MKFPRLPVLAAHLIGWLLFQSLPLAFLLSQSGTSLVKVLTSFAYWQFVLYYIVVFYLHEYVLLPKLFNNRKKLLYIAAIFILLLSAFYFQPFEKLSSSARVPRTENRMMPPPPEGDQAFRPLPPMNMNGAPRGPLRVDIISIFLFVMTIMFGIAIDITRRWRLTEQRAARAEADKANAELSFLKAQINPHFLFNTLNNIYSMSVTGNENTPVMLLKLSNIMRYVTDDVNEDYVSLASEIECISDYIDLQKLRLGKKADLKYTVTGHLENKKIAPLILMTFIENVFKYGISNHEKSELIIRIDVNDDGLYFVTQNRLFAVARKDDRTGIGITNTQKRLDHLYPGKHKLTFTRENGFFKVELYLLY